MPDTDPQDRGESVVKVRTLADLAKIAGVSPGTVSRALAGNSLVNAKTREKIEAIAREHGFRPNQMASKLRRQKTGLILCHSSEHLAQLPIGLRSVDFAWVCNLY